MAAYLEDTIAAIATATGRGAIAILRISGREARTVAARILRPALGAGAREKAQPADIGGEPRATDPGFDPPNEGGHRGFSLEDSHRARRALLLDPDQGTALDDVLVLPMHAPGTATGEDVVEIHCHGSALLADRALRAALANGARTAAPGEFTRRAFLNGRLDLCQAEAVADLAEATSEAGLHAAWQQLEGRLSARIEALRGGVLDARALVEAHLDFPEEDLPPESSSELRTQLDALRYQIETLCATFARGRLARDGVRVALIGRPNVGKSSLMNAFLGRERALVSDRPGTTRDWLEEPLALGDHQILLSDTAGIRQTADGIEQAGMERSRAHLDAADLVVLVFDGSTPLTEEDHQLLGELGDKPVVHVRNKADCERAWSDDALAAAGVGSAPLAISALRGDGLETLSSAILERLDLRDERATEEVRITRARHHEALRSGAAALERALRLLSEGAGLDLVACELQAATADLDALLGLSTPEDVLDRIFERFCIGK